MNEDLIGYSWTSDEGIVYTVIPTSVDTVPGYVDIEMAFPDGSKIVSCRVASQVRVHRAGQKS